jgi:hypothetical protein
MLGMGRVGHPPGLGRRAVGKEERKKLPPRHHTRYLDEKDY